MKSMRVATTVVRTLGLNADPSFLGIKPSALPSFKPIDVNDASRMLRRCPGEFMYAS